MEPLSIITFLLGCTLTWWLARKSSKELKQTNANLRADNAAVRTDNAELRESISELRRDNGELKALVEKLPADFRSAIASDPRSTLTAQQLHEVSRTVAELHERQQPRKLTPEQREALASSLQSIPPEPIGVLGAPSNSESKLFADEIGEVFQSAGWPTEIRTAIHADTIEGIQIVYLTGETWDATPLPMPEVVTTLAAALDHAGLKATPAAFSGTPRSWQVGIYVGHKPRM
jgi:hypothetical protein